MKKFLWCIVFTVFFSLGFVPTASAAEGEFDVYSYNIFGGFIGNITKSQVNYGSDRANVGEALYEQLNKHPGVGAIVGLQEDWQSAVDCVGPFWSREHIRAKLPYISLPGDTRDLAASLLPCDIPQNDGLTLLSSFPIGGTTVSASNYGEIFYQWFQVLGATH